MHRGFLSLAAVAMLAILCLPPAPSRADDGAEWEKDRQARFVVYRAAHPRQDAEIRRLKTKTAALLSAPAPAPSHGANAGSKVSGATAGEDIDADRPPVVWKTSPSPLALWDAADAPEMVVVPAGEYTMGSPASEPTRIANEGPRHRVRIGYAFAVSKSPITVGEFARFVAETHADTGDSCYTYEGEWKARSGRSWRAPGFDQGSTSPAVCLNWDDAKAYAAWLSKKTGHPYRLLSEAEYEYVNRAGTTSVYWWGDDPADACRHANAADLSLKSLFPSYIANSCDDGFPFTSPLGSFAPNPFGLYDTTGNIWSWIEDCWSDDYAASPQDGSANSSPDCSRRQRRGGRLGEQSAGFPLRHPHPEPSDQSQQHQRHPRRPNALTGAGPLAVQEATTASGAITPASFRIAIIGSKASP